MNTTRIEEIMAAAYQAAGYYGEHPGHIGADAVIDLYRTIGLLCALLLESRSDGANQPQTAA